jgi:hypothetical protein
MSYTIGSDPEFFVKKINGPNYPAFKVIRGTKESPTDVGEGYSVLYDNVLIEGNVPPANSMEEFIKHIRTLKMKMRGVLRPSHCDLYESDVENFLPEHLETEEAKLFGCLPYVDAWSWGEVKAPEIKSTYRTAGFHIHVGYENKSKYPKEIVNIAIARAFDFFAVFPSRFEKSDIRRDENYGAYGSFRHKPYGLELRALSGYFAKDCYLKWVYTQTIKAVDFVLEYDLVEDMLDLTKEHLNTISAESKLGIMLSSEKVFKDTIALEKVVT